MIVSTQLDFPTENQVKIFHIQIVQSFLQSNIENLFWGIPTSVINKNLEEGTEIMSFLTQA